MSLSKRAIAELFGTFWLVFGGCGSAVLAAVFRNWAFSGRRLVADSRGGRSGPHYILSVDHNGSDRPQCPAGFV